MPLPRCPPGPRPRSVPPSNRVHRCRDEPGPFATRAESTMAGNGAPPPLPPGPSAPPPTPVGYPSPLPGPEYAPGPPPRSRLWLIVIPVVALVIVLALVRVYFSGVIPGFRPTPAGSGAVSFARARAAANLASGGSAAPQDSLLLAAGVD